MEVYIMITKEQENLILANGNIYNIGHETYINLPQWFIKVGDKGKYKMLLAKEIEGEIGERIRTIVLSQTNK